MSKKRAVEGESEEGRKALRVKEKEEEEEEEEEELSSCEQEDEEDSESDDDLLLEKQADEELVNMSFDFNDMKEEYSDGVSRMLHHLYDNEPDALEIANVITQQDIVGTAVCSEGESDVFAYATILPITNTKECKNISDILSDMLESCKKLSNGENKDAIIDHINGEKSKSTGLFLHGRYMNLPLQLSVALHSNLVDDLNWAKDKSDDEDAIPFKEMEFLLLIAPCNMGNGQEVAKNSCVDIQGNSSVMFDNFEDDIYFQESEFSYAFKSSKSDSTVGVVLVPIASLSKCISQINDMVAA